MRVFLGKLILFLTVFTLLNTVFASIVDDDLTANRRNKYHWVCSRGGNTYDIALVGSSRVEMTVDPRLIDEALNTNSINIGVSGGGAGDQYLLTHHLLTQNRVGTVLYQIDYLTLASKFTYDFKDYIWLSYTGEPEVREALIGHRGWMHCLAWKIFPFLRLMEFSSQYQLFQVENDGRYWDERKGGQQRDTPFAPESQDSFCVYRPVPLAIEYVRRTFDLCKKNRVRLILFQAPLPASLDNVSQFPECTALIEELAAEYGLEYWNDSALYRNRSELFYDNHHLNSEGVRQFTAVLTARLSQISIISPAGIQQSGSPSTATQSQ
ncbi:MAG: hypothetical protein R3C49_23715 [Planctomycetaceae bacterium]